MWNHAIRPIVTAFAVVVCLCGWAWRASAQDAPALPAPTPGATPAQVAPASQGPATDQYRFAEGLMARKFYDLAEKEWGLFLEQHGEHELAPRAMLGLIECLRYENKGDEALAAISKFQQRWPQHELVPRLFLWKGEQLLSRKQFEPAIECFKQLESNPDTVIQEAALYFLAQCLAQQGLADRAMAYYGKIPESPFDAAHAYRPYAAFAMASARQAKGEFDAAVEAFSRLKGDANVPPVLREEALYRVGEIRFVRGDFDGASKSYELLLAEFPTGALAREAGKRRVWACLSGGDYARAVELADEWKRQHGEAFDYEMGYIHALSLMGAGRFADALPLLQKLTGAAGVPEEYVRMARHREVYAQLRLEKFTEAADKARLFAKDFPKASELADVCYFGGEALYRAGDFPGAVEQLRRALDSFTGDWEYWEPAALRLAECYRKQGKPKDEAAVFRRLSSNAKLAKPAQMLLRAGECERQAEDWRAAVTDYENVLTRFPTSEDEGRIALVSLGELYAHLKEYDRAIGMMRDLLTREGEAGKARVLFFLGYLFHQQQKYGEAEQHLRQALAAKGSDKIAQNARYYLAASLLELNRDDEALDLFAQVLSLELDRRPEFSVPMLFRLDDLYYRRGQYPVSEVICRWLATNADPAVVARAKLRLARNLAVQARLAEARTFLEGLMVDLGAGDGAKAPGVGRGEVMSLLGEVLMLQQETDRAVGVFEQALASGDVDVEGATRARWGLAEILRREQKLNQALRYAVSAFVVGDDPTYTPRAMLLAIEILLDQGKAGDAVATWRELQARFPAFAEQKLGEAAVKRVLEAEKVPPPAGGK
ncbi:MAG: hypothetical protein A3K19_26295 [Lentisphaerae bacterium RIFOXYB12_FULL_65_16]|nr:MAG: hypothetical protein A3K19_26295 [Lentisphaerae bacterium RIFOXYB12_FULL_65_16]